MKPAIPTRYRPRLADKRLRELMSTFPAVLISGPRASGKTTTARQLVADIVRLDDPSQAVAFRADPNAALEARATPVLLDEWQEVPGVLGAVKRAVDEGAGPGSFILTGSIQPGPETSTWPGTGRLIPVSMYGVTDRELLENVSGPSFFEKLAENDPKAFPLPRQKPTLTDYLTRALRSGFPQLAYHDVSEDVRRTWLDAYLQQMIERDLSALHPRGEHDKMLRYFQALCINTAGHPTQNTLQTAAGINVATAGKYEDLFARLYIAEQVPAWSDNRLKRLMKATKRYIVDPGLAANAVGFDLKSILDEGDFLGRLFDTYAMAQLRPEIALSSKRGRLHHLRTEKGRQEVDLLVEVEGGRVMALEFKASSAPTKSDANHLEWLREALGKRFIAGAVIHTGGDVFRLSERVLAVPLCAAWG